MKIFILFSILVIVKNSDFDYSQTYHKILDFYSEGSPKELFKTWHFLNKKEYDLNSEQALQRYRVFKDNLKYIKAHNEKKLSYELGLNQFSDLTFEEFKQKYTIRPINLDLRTPNINFDILADLKEEENPEDKNLTQYASIDYSNLAEVRSTGDCGSCWAMSATTAIEVYRAINFKKREKVSPQYLVDCSYYDGGCNGGLPQSAFEYVKETGIPLEVNYPYTAKQGDCQGIKGPKISITDYSYCHNDYTFELYRCSISRVYNLLK